MSTKSSLFLTSDNEHCYSDCSFPHFDENGKHLGNEITLEFDRKNLTHARIEDEYVELTVKPGTEIYKLIELMDVEHPKKLRNKNIEELKIKLEEILKFYENTEKLSDYAKGIKSAIKMILEIIN